MLLPLDIFYSHGQSSVGSREQMLPEEKQRPLLEGRPERFGKYHLCYRWIRFEIFNGLKEDTYLGHPLNLLLAPQQEEWAEYAPYEPLSVIWTRR